MYRPLKLACGMAAAAGLALLMSAPGAHAADLYDDYRHGSLKDRWGDEERLDYRDRGNVRSACASREGIRDRLIADGWRDFDNPDPRGAFVVVEARRPSGRLFQLRIDRCTGEVVLARPLEPRPRYWYRSRWDDRWDDRPAWPRRPLVGFTRRADRWFY